MLAEKKRWLIDTNLSYVNIKHRNIHIYTARSEQIEKKIRKISSFHFQYGS